MKCPYCNSTVLIPPELQDRPVEAAPPAVVIQMPNTSGATAAAQSAAGFTRVIVAIVLLSVACVLCTTLAPLLGVGLAIPGILSGFGNPLDFTSGGSYAHVVMSFGGQGTAPGLFQRARRVAVDGSG